MTEIDAYQEYIRCKHNAFCKAVIRYAAIGKIIRLRQKWEREIPLDYLTNEKFIQFAEPEPDEEHPLTVCGQTVLLSNASLTNLRWYTDDGYSGANFQRPGFQSMLADIEAGKVGTVIVKDMSRLGRNYLQVDNQHRSAYP